MHQHQDIYLYQDTYIVQCDLGSICNASMQHVFPQHIRRNALQHNMQPIRAHDIGVILVCLASKELVTDLYR